MKKKKYHVISLLEESDCFRLTLSFKIANPCKPFFKAASREVNQAFNYVNSVTYKYTKNYLYSYTYNRYLDTYRANHLFKNPLEKRNIKKIAYKVSPEELKAFKKSNRYIQTLTKKQLKAENQAIQKHNRNLYSEIRQLTLKELGWTYLPTLSEFDLNKTLAGCTINLDEEEKLKAESKDPVVRRTSQYNPYGFSRINTAIVQQIIKEVITRKKQFKKIKLHYRRSYGSGSSLGWIPFKQENMSTWINGIRFSGRNAKLPNDNKIKQIFTYYKAFLEDKNTGLSQHDPKVTKPSMKGLLAFYCKYFLENKKSDINNPVFNKKNSQYGKNKKTNLLLKFNGKKIRLRNQDTLMYYLTCLGAEVKTGSINQDSLDDWYLNLSVKVDKDIYRKYHLQFMQGIGTQAPHKVVGIDPGQKTLLTCIDENDSVTKHKGKKFYTDSQEKLANYQNKKYTKQVKRLHRKIKRQRQYNHHAIANALIREYAIIKIGDLNVKFLNQSNMAKASYDLGLGQLKMILNHKCHRAGRWFFVVPEKYSTQRCSSCKGLTGPKGTEGLKVRCWTCTSCGQTHDRDENAAKNIRDIQIIVCQQDYEFLVQQFGKELPNITNGDKKHKQKEPFGVGLDFPIPKQGCVLFG